MAQTRVGRGSEDRAERAALNRSQPGGGGDHRRVPASHAAAAGRLPLRPATDDPAPDALFFAPLPAASRHQPVAGDRWRQADEKKFKRYPIGYFHVDLAELRTAEGKLYLFVAIDRTSKFAFAQLVERANTQTASAFLDALVEAVPYEIHTVLTDNGIQFADLPKNRNGATARLRGHPFDRTCWRHGIEHRLTRPKHPWTNGQVERMNRTIKDATVKRFHYDSHDQLRAHLGDFVSAYNFARRLKTLKGLTPYEYICKIWTKEPERFTLDPIHQMPGLNT
jgi:transposase InsO family protein